MCIIYMHMCMVFAKCVCLQGQHCQRFETAHNRKRRTPMTAIEILIFGVSVRQTRAE